MCTAPAFDAHDPLGLGDLLSDEDRAVRRTVRSWAANRARPHIADWYEADCYEADCYERGEPPGIRELARELGFLADLGMSLEGYGCAGAGAVRYGLAWPAPNLGCGARSAGVEPKWPEVDGGSRCWAAPDGA